MNWARSLLRKLRQNRWVLRLIGIGIFILILIRVDLREVYITLTTVDILLVVLSLAIQGVALVVATVRWQLILQNLDIRIPFYRTFLQQLVGTAAALVTPGQLGEFIKVLYLRNEGQPVPESFLSVVIDRAYDLLFLFLFGFISFAILFGLPVNITILLAIAASVLFVAGFLFFRNKERSAQIIANTLKRITPKAYKDTVQDDAYRLTRKIAEFDLKFLVYAGLLTALNYILLLFRVYAIVLSLHLVVPIGYFVLVVPILRLVGLVPISVLGLGTRDLTTIYLFGQVGVPETSALLISALGLLTILVQAIIGLIVMWLYPYQSTQEEPQPYQEPLKTEEHP